MTNEEKLQNFQAMTMETARKKGAEEIDAYLESMEQAFEEHKNMKEQQAQGAIRTIRENLHKVKNKEVSLEQIRLRHEYSQKHEELKEKLFSEVNDLLANYMRTPAYEKLLLSQIKKDLQFAKGEPVVIYIDPADSTYLMNLEMEAGTTLTVSEYSFGGGTRAVLPERNVLIDDSFDTKVKEIMENFSFTGGDING